MTIQKLKDLIEEEGIESSFLYKEGFECLIVRIRPETSGYLCGIYKNTDESSFLWQELYRHRKMKPMTMKFHLMAD